MENFELLEKEIQAGIDGKNSGIPMGFVRLSKYVGIRKRIMTTVLGATGTGKSAIVHNAYILQPFDFIRKTPNLNIKMKVILFSMERSKIYILAKWLSREIFLSQGILIPLQKLLGWWDTKLTKDEHDLVLMYKDYICELEQFCDIIEGAQNPTGIYKYVKKYAMENGIFEEKDEFTKVYIPNHSNEIVIPIVDHYLLTKLEKPFLYKKEAIDKLSEYFQVFRDQYGYSPVGVSQINRELGSALNRKVSDTLEPTIDHIKESGAPGEASDIVISLFQPSKYKTEDISYKVDKFIDPNTGGDFFRSLKILKHSYGEDSSRIGLGFMGSIGLFSELPKPKDMDTFDYDNLFNYSFFLKDN